MKRRKGWSAAPGVRSIKRRGGRGEVEGLSRYFGAVRDLAPLTREEEHELAVRARGGDALARQALVRHNLALVVSVRLAKLRWRVERDYQELKEEIGLDNLKGAAGGDSTTTSPYARRHRPSSRSTERFSPRGAKRWTLPMVRKQLQLVLLRRIGMCPLCRQRVDASTRPRGPSRL
jgi:hypothetical protein